MKVPPVEEKQLLEHQKFSQECIYIQISAWKRQENAFGSFKSIGLGNKKKELLAGIKISYFVWHTYT